MLIILYFCMVEKKNDYLDLETERSLKVLKMKEAHASIEEVERQRKRSAVLSVRTRLKSHIDLLDMLSKGARKCGNSLNDDFRNKLVKEAQEKADTMMKQLTGLDIKMDMSPTVDKAIDDERKEVWAILLPMVKIVVDMVDSLRHDYQKALDIGQKDFDILFPKVKINLEAVKSVDNQLIELFIQEANMIMYCDRLL